MGTFDKIVITFYAIAMTILLVLGSCELDLPVFLFGAVIAFVATIAIIKQSQANEHSDENEQY